MNSVSATEALVVSAELLTQLHILAPSWVYQALMERVDISDEYFQGVILELRRLSDISIEGDILRARFFTEDPDF